MYDQVHRRWLQQRHAWVTTGCDMRTQGMNRQKAFPVQRAHSAKPEIIGGGQLRRLCYTTRITHSLQ